ncbi:winged helix-turn-helix transcriptional regulator [Streptomyces lydicus]|uniref:winged helix-turn-helix transcriptional regulator n=1 Tax=Streptomyces lydicus TaxID=47763 RepID=UPI0037A1925B
MTLDHFDRQSQQDAGRARVVLGMVGDEWSPLVVCRLDQGPRRFTELKRAVDGISQRMLTVTLRSLERDGILTRTVHNVMPPHVTYELTPMSPVGSARAWAGAGARSCETTGRHLAVPREFRNPRFRVPSCVQAPFRWSEEPVKDQGSNGSSR